MCISAAMLAAVGGATAGVASIYSAVEARSARKDAAGAQARADATATQTANARLAQRRRALSANSLVSDQSTSGMASTGRATLGGG